MDANPINAPEYLPDWKKPQKMEFGFSSCKSGKIINNNLMKKLWAVFFQKQEK